MTFADKCMMVFKAKGFTDAEIEESKQAIREAWPDEQMRTLWVGWINAEAEVWK